MSKTLFVGIDVSSQNNEVYFMDEKGQGPKNSFSVPNDFDGADKIIQDSISYSQKIGASQIQIGMESTSFYAWHLHQHLVSSMDLQVFNPLFFVLNPSIVAGFKKSYPHLPKTDSIDAWVIADCIRFGRVQPTPNPDLRYLALQRLTRFRHRLVNTVTREKNRALSLLFLKFSSFEDGNHFSNIWGKASTALLESFNAEEISTMPLEDLVDFIISHGNNRLNNPERIAQEIKKCANRAYRLNPELDDSVGLTLSMTIENIKFFESQIKKIDKEIVKHLRAFKQTLETVPGIGPTLAAGILAEVGDIARFKNEASLAKFAGLVWNKYQSGNFCAEETSLAKCGNFYLRYYLVEAANSLRLHNSEYAEFYHKKHKEVTKHRHKRALVLTARKFIRLVFSLLNKGQIYQDRRVSSA